ncbi:MalY/PatB family protein [uncultured Oscillibacter sp.]|mgnify:FL=1|uniref:MalY/PatB family protein n=1 Tax=uncultured Oscillibacter sp. TaxID=876091 RepID=UPI002604D6C0|nr:MalY/PatB family protein [uncultured Oscillibacter sp.]
MKYDFDEIIDRRGTSSSKWDNVGPRVGNPDALPMWVADTDFRCPQPIVDAVLQRAAHPVYGYPFVTPDFKQATVDWVEKRHGWKMDPEWLVFATGIVPVFNTMIQALSQEGDRIIISRPVYHPFGFAIEDNHREISDNSLIYRDGRYTIDFDDLRRRAADPRAKLMIISNPHNPVGRVWTPEELTEMSSICAENGVTVICDEIHSDLMLYGHRHTPMGMLGSEEMRRNIITCYAPSKTFNCAGLRGSAVAVPDPALRKLLNDRFKMNRSIQQNIFAVPALTAAYTQCEDYLEQLLPYLEKNVDFLRSYLKEKMPRIKLVEPESTYLMWLDCTDLGISGDELARFIIHECRVAVSRGDGFGQEGRNFIRLNIGCPTAVLKQGLDQIYQQYQTRF